MLSCNTHWNEQAPESEGGVLEGRVVILWLLNITTALTNIYTPGRLLLSHILIDIIILILCGIDGIPFEYKIT